MERHYLTSLLAPSSVAVFAGSPAARENDPAIVGMLSVVHDHWQLSPRLAG